MTLGSRRERLTGNLFMLIVPVRWSDCIAKELARVRILGTRSVKSKSESFGDGNLGSELDRLLLGVAGRESLRLQPPPAAVITKGDAPSTFVGRLLGIVGDMKGLMSVSKDAATPGASLNAMVEAAPQRRHPQRRHPQRRHP